MSEILWQQLTSNDPPRFWRLKRALWALTAVVVLMILLAAAPARTAVIPVVSGGEAAAIKAAQPGDRLVFSGVFDHILVKGKTWSAAVTFDMRAAKVANLRFQDSAGISVLGGAYSSVDNLGAIYFGSTQHVRVQGISATGPHGGVIFRDSSDVALINSRIDGATVAVSVFNTDGFLVQGNVLTRMTTDGVDMFGARHGKMLGNTCSDANSSALPHPDCGQVENIAGFPPVSDIEIGGNVATGASQGFSRFEHHGVAADHLWFHDNTVSLTYPQGLNMDGPCTSCSMTNNHASTLSGSKYRTSIHYAPGIMGCGNTAAAAAGKPAWADAVCKTPGTP